MKKPIELLIGVVLVLAAVWIYSGQIKANSRDFMPNQVEKEISTVNKADDFFDKRPKFIGHAFDFTSSVPPGLLTRIDGYADTLYYNLNIDFVLAIVPSLNGLSLQDYASQMFTNWEAGRDTQGKRGVLILIAKNEKKIKIEVGYDLESIYTDLYIGRVERELLEAFLAQADWERGFFSVMENFYGHAEDAVKKSELNTKATPDNRQYWSGGAGASGTFDLGSALNKPLPQAPQELQAYFGAQPTPAQAFDRYMELCGRGIMDHTLNIYSDDTRNFFKNWPTAPGQARAEAEHFSAVPYIVKQKGDRAVILFDDRNDPDVIRTHNPYFIKKDSKGWQIDLATMSSCIIMARAFNWYFGSEAHPYMFAFVGDYYIKWPCGFYPYDGQKAYIGFTYEHFDSQRNLWYVRPEFESAAIRAGVTPDGGYLVSVDGVPITKKFQDWEMMKNYQPGQVINIEIIQNGQKRVVPVKLRKVGPYEGEKGKPWIGLYWGYAPDKERTSCPFGNAAFKVTGVEKGSPADKAGIQTGDCILDEYDIGFKLYLDKLKPGDQVTYQIVRGNKKMDITIDVSKQED